MNPKCDIRDCKKEALNRDLMHNIYLCNRHASDLEQHKITISEIQKDKIRQSAEKKAMSKMNQIIGGFV